MARGVSTNNLGANLLQNDVDPSRAIEGSDENGEKGAAEKAGDAQQEDRNKLNSRHHIVLLARLLQFISNYKITVVVR